MNDESRPVEGPYAEELKSTEAIIGEIEHAETEYRAGNPIAARMHLWDAIAKLRAMLFGEMV